MNSRRNYNDDNNESLTNQNAKCPKKMRPTRNCADNNNTSKLLRTKYLKHNLQLTLEEMYTGATRHLHVKRDVVCGTCQGSGSTSEVKKYYDTCEKCHGKGVRSFIRRTSHNVEEEFEQRCDLCWGKGKAVSLGLRCGQCKGGRTIPDDSFLVVKVRRGTKNGQRIIYEGEGPQEPNRRPANVIVTLEAMDHQTYKRQGDDLVMTMSLDLVESLCGFRKLLTTLDKRQLIISSPRGKVVQDKDVKYIVGEGMPKYANPNERGNLIINFEVNVPSSINYIFAPSIEECLPPRETVAIPLDAHERNMMRMAKPEEEKDGKEQSHSSYVTIEEDFDPHQNYGTNYQYESEMSESVYDEHSQDKHYFANDSDEHDQHQGQHYYQSQEHESGYDYENYDAPHQQYHEQQHYPYRYDKSMTPAVPSSDKKINVENFRRDVTRNNKKL